MLPRELLSVRVEEFEHQSRSPHIDIGIGFHAASLFRHARLLLLRYAIAITSVPGRITWPVVITFGPKAVDRLFVAAGTGSRTLKALFFAYRV